MAAHLLKKRGKKTVVASLEALFGVCGREGREGRQCNWNHATSQQATTATLSLIKSYWPQYISPTTSQRCV